MRSSAAIRPRRLAALTAIALAIGLATAPQAQAVSYYIEIPYEDNALVGLYSGAAHGDPVDFNTNTNQGALWTFTGSGDNVEIHPYLNQSLCVVINLNSLALYDESCGAANSKWKVNTNGPYRAFLNVDYFNGSEQIDDPGPERGTGNYQGIVAGPVPWGINGQSMYQGS